MALVVVGFKIQHDGGVGSVGGDVVVAGRGSRRRGGCGRGSRRGGGRGRGSSGGQRTHADVYFPDTFSGIFYCMTSASTTRRQDLGVRSTRGQLTSVQHHEGADENSIYGYLAMVRVVNIFRNAGPEFRSPELMPLYIITIAVTIEINYSYY